MALIQRLFLTSCGEGEGYRDDEFITRTPSKLEFEG